MSHNSFAAIRTGRTPVSAASVASRNRAAQASNRSRQALQARVRSQTAARARMASRPAAPQRQQRTTQSSEGSSFSSFMASRRERTSGMNAQRRAANQSSGGGMSNYQMNKQLNAQRTQDAARNKQIQDTLLRQRQQQAKLMEQARTRLKGAGTAAKARAAKASQKLEARGKQNLIGRGLFNTTVTSGFERGVASDLSTQNQAIDEGVSSRIASTYEREAGMQIPEANTQLSGIGQQQGGLQDYIKLIMMMQGGMG